MRAESGLEIVLHAPLAAAAHKLGDESQYIVWATARAMDPRGSGRVSYDAIARELSSAFSKKQIGRILRSTKGQRWWDLELDYLRLTGQEALLEGFEVELPVAIGSRRFLLADLDTRPRRTAALLAAVVAGEGPRSYAFISRFCGVDRSTIRRLLRDEFISAHILNSHAEWAFE